MSRNYLDLAKTALVKIIAISLFATHPSSQHSLRQRERKKLTAKYNTLSEYYIFS
jgi:hypothetical protein